MDNFRQVLDNFRQVAEAVKRIIPHEQIEAAMKIRLQWEAECDKMERTCLEELDNSSPDFQSDVKSAIRLYTSVGVENVDKWINGEG